jgi:predicted DNA-binding protein with PD1-like motif
LEEERIEEKRKRREGREEQKRRTEGEWEIIGMDGNIGREDSLKIGGKGEEEKRV